MKRFPPPWTVEAIGAGFKVVDANKQAIAYVYGHADPRDAGIANALTLDEARRIRRLDPSTWDLIRHGVLSHVLYKVGDEPGFFAVLNSPSIEEAKAMV